MLLMLPLLGASLFARPRPPGQALPWLWLGYYLFLVIVVFHVEVRYRSAYIPFALALAAGGAGSLARREAGAGMGAFVGLALAASTLKPWGLAIVPSENPGFPSRIAAVRTPCFFVGRVASPRASAPTVRRPATTIAAMSAVAGKRGKGGRFIVGLIAT